MKLHSHDDEQALTRDEKNICRDIVLIGRAVAGWGCKVVFLDDSGPDFQHGMFLISHDNKFYGTDLSGCTS